MNLIGCAVDFAVAEVCLCRDYSETFAFGSQRVAGVDGSSYLGFEALEVPVDSGEHEAEVRVSARGSSFGSVGVCGLGRLEGPGLWGHTLRILPRELVQLLN